jgi:predicted phosphodiesterase/GAF domain-containing protein
MYTSVPSAPGRNRIVIHHLSDLHYAQESQGSEPDALDRYKGYLETLKAEDRPSLVVITGDVTSTGNRSDLNTVAEILRKGFPRWVGDLADHIFVVPGPRDINWEDGKEPPGLRAYYEAFRHFGLPSATHAAPSSGARAIAGSSCIVYPIDTCYSLADLRDEMKNQFHDYGDTYFKFVKQYKGARQSTGGLFGSRGRDRKAELADFRKRYLELTEANDLTLLDAGKIDSADLAAFESWIASWGQGQGAERAANEALKILVTHHPLPMQQDLDHLGGGTRRKETPFERLASAAGKAGFHLALHGHIHKPQVLSDLSLLQESATRHPMRQVGAGSLGDGGTFNEITATYTKDGDQNHWRLEIRTINLKAPKPDEAVSFVLLNRTEDAAKRAEDLDREKTRREEFDRRVSTVMSQYSEGVYRAHPGSALDRPATVLLPQLPMQSVESIIREVVLPGFSLRVRLFLKEKQRSRLVPKLSAVYLAPPLSDGSDPVSYPISLAALSLVLGKTLVYPRALTAPLDNSDYEWLRRSSKDKELVRILEALIQETLPTSYPGPQEAQRVQALLTKLTQGLAQPLVGADFYRDAPLQDVLQTYPEFICVPFPKRSPAGVVPDVPEVAVLVVSAKMPERTGDDRAPADARTEQVFTPERVAMLESLAELIGMILINSSALGKPKGVWDERLWA